MIEVIYSDKLLEALVPRWQTLWLETQGASPFLSPAWLMSWWRCFGTGKPRVAFATCPGQDGSMAAQGQSHSTPVHRRSEIQYRLVDEGKLEGLLALYVLEDKHGRRLLPMGVGVTDNLDALGSNTEILLAALLAEDEACDLPDLAPESCLRVVAHPPAWTETQWTGDPCPVLMLPRCFDTLLASVSRGTRRYWQQAAKRAGDRIRVDRAGRDISVSEALDALFVLHGRRWAGRQETGVVAEPRVQEFHREAAPRLLADGSLRLEVLYIDGEPAAAHLSLLAAGRLLHYLTGFDPAFEALRPGTLLLAHVIASAIDEERCELHFLRGSEGYKYAWGGVDRMNIGRRLRRESC